MVTHTFLYTVDSNWNVVFRTDHEYFSEQNFFLKYRS